MSLLDVIQVTEQRTITVQVAGKMNSQYLSQRREAAPVRWTPFHFCFSSPLLSAALTFAISAKEEIKFGEEEVSSFVKMKK